MWSSSSSWFLRGGKMKQFHSQIPLCYSEILTGSGKSISKVTHFQGWKFDAGFYSGVLAALWMGILEGLFESQHDMTTGIFQYEWSKRWRKKLQCLLFLASEVAYHHICYNLLWPSKTSPDSMQEGHQITRTRIIWKHLGSELLLYLFCLRPFAGYKNINMAIP
jgi:hypothetical protein